MNDFCRSCQERGTANCALPSIGDKLNDMAHYLGQELLVGVVSGGMLRPAYVPAYAEYLQAYRTEQLEQREEAVTECVASHQVQPV